MLMNNGTTSAMPAQPGCGCAAAISPANTATPSHMKFCREFMARVLFSIKPAVTSPSNDTPVPITPYQASSMPTSR